MYVDSYNSPSILRRDDGTPTYSDSVVSNIDRKFTPFVFVNARRCFLILFQKKNISTHRYRDAACSHEIKPEKWIFRNELRPNGKIEVKEKGDEQVNS